MKKREQSEIQICFKSEPQGNENYVTGWHDISQII